MGGCAVLFEDRPRIFAARATRGFDAGKQERQIDPGGSTSSVRSAEEVCPPSANEDVVGTHVIVHDPVAADRLREVLLDADQVG